MSEKEQLKRQIVRQTVDENLALIEGVRFTFGLPQGPRRHGLRRVALFLLAVVLGYVDLHFGRLTWVSDTSGLLSRPRDRAFLTAPPRPTDEAAVPRRSRWATDVSVRHAPERIDPSVFPLQVRHIVLDPGHGGEDRGTQNGALYEKDLVLDIALQLRGMLEAKGFDVSMTRETDRPMVLRERSDFANRVDADLFVSVHINWLVTRQVRGVETYYLGPTEDPELEALARLENKNSGYSLADQDNIIRNVILNAQSERSQQLASRVQQSIFRSLRPINPQLKNRGVKTAPFVVLVTTEMPAILAEVSCLSNAEEAKYLARPLYRKHIAEALYKGILTYAKDVNPTDGPRLGP